MHTIPQQAIDIIKQFEGCRLQPYLDAAGKPTIGIGHLMRPGEGYKDITQEDAEELLIKDLQKTANSVLKLITRPLTDNQYAALLSFTFNLGGGALQRSTLRMKCNRGEDDAVPHEFLKWVYAGGKKLPGLLRRRHAEAALYVL